MTAALRKIADGAVFAASAELDREYMRMERHERTVRERDSRNGTVELTDAHMATREAAQSDPLDRLIFWDILRECDHETALYYVLRFCLGYSRLEIASGLGVALSRIRYKCETTAKRLRSPYS